MATIRMFWELSSASNPPPTQAFPALHLQFRYTPCLSRLKTTNVLQTPSDTLVFCFTLDRPHPPLRVNNPPHCSYLPLDWPKSDNTAQRYCRWNYVFIQSYPDIRKRFVICFVVPKFLPLVLLKTVAVRRRRVSSNGGTTRTGEMRRAGRTEIVILSVTHCRHTGFGSSLGQWVWEQY